MFLPYQALSVHPFFQIEVLAVRSCRPIVMLLLQLHTVVA